MFSETMIKTLLKSIDFEKLAKTPQVAELISIATSIRDDFAAIKENQAEILRRLDRIERGAETDAVIDLEAVKTASNGKDVWK